MLRLLTATAFLACAAIPVAAPVLAQDIAPERRDAFIAMFAASGCAISEADADAAMDAAGFTYDEANAILEALVAEGTASYDGSSAKLDSSICPGSGGTSVAGGGTPAPEGGAPGRDAFIAAIVSNGCSMTESEADTLLAGAGFTMETSRPIAQALIAEGLASFAGGRFELAPELCTAGGSTAGGGSTTGGEMDPKAAFLALIADNGCTLVEADAEELLGSVGLTMDQTIPIVNELLAAGTATYANGVLTVDQATCLAAAGGGDTTTTTGGGDADKLAAAIMATGSCSITEDQGDAVLAAAGLTEDQAGAVVEQWMSSGAATFENDRLTLGSSLCPLGGSTPGTTGGMSPADILFTAVQANGCSMTEDEAEATLPGLGLDMEQAEDIARGWIAEGKAEFANDALVLHAPFCTASTGGATGGTVEPGSDAEKMANAIRENGCRMTGDEAEATLVPLGFTEDTAGAIAQQWIADGLASFEGDSLVLGPALCGGGDAGTTGGPAGSGDTAERLAAVIRAEGCSMRGEDAEAKLPGMGFTEEGVGPIVDAWIGAGLAAIEGGSLVLGEKLCSESMALTAEDHSKLLVAAVEANGCSLGGDVGEKVVTALGIPLDTVPGIAEALVASGRASLTDDTLTVHTEICP